MPQKQFHINQRISKSKDILRQYLFEVRIPTPPGLKNAWDEDDMVIRVRTAQIPARGNEPIQSDFFGMKRFYHGKVNYENTLTLQIEEYDDTKSMLRFEQWNNLLTDMNHKQNSGAAKDTRDQLISDIELITYKANGHETEAHVTLYNAFISNVATVSLAYGVNESVKYEVVFTYDYWLFTNPDSTDSPVDD
jgi:hypothetical protein